MTKNNDNANENTTEATIAHYGPWERDAEINEEPEPTQQFNTTEALSVSSCVTAVWRAMYFAWRGIYGIPRYDAKRRGDLEHQ